MRIEDGRAALPILFRARVVPFLWGPTSVGKTALTMLVASDISARYHALHLGYQDQPDMIGVMRTDLERTAWKVPEWWPQGDEKLVIHLDEYNRCRNESVMAIAMHMTDKRMYHTHQLTEETHLVAAGNPAGSGYNVNPMRDPAHVSRFCHLLLDHNHGEFISYARDTGVHPDVVAYLEERPDAIEADAVDFDVDIRPWKKSWEAYSAFLKEGGSDLDPDLQREVCAGLIGAPEADRYHSGADKMSVEDALGDDLDEVLKKFEILVSSGRTDHVIALLQGILLNMRDVADTREHATSRLMSILEVAPREIGHWAIKTCVQHEPFKTCFLPHVDTLQRLFQGSKKEEP